MLQVSNIVNGAKYLSVTVTAIGDGPKLFKKRFRLDLRRYAFSNTSC